MPRGHQLARQWRLLQLIDRPAGVSVDDAAGELDCAVRTIWRDLQVLETAGFPIYCEKAADGPRNIWRIDEGFRARLPLKLTLAELAAILMSRELLSPVGASVLGPSVSSAFDKIAGVLSKDAMALLDRMRATIGVRTLGAKLQQPIADYLPTIQTALLERRTLGLRYYSLSRDEETRRSVDPYHLTYFDGGLYLVGYCHLRKEIRVFAVERIRTVDLQRGHFSVPADFNAAGYLNQAWGIVHGTLVTVKVVFARGLAPYIADRLWHPTQKLRTLGDGRLEVTLRVADTLEVRRWILGYGMQAEVVEPHSLREALRREAEGLVRTLTPRRPPLAAIALEGHVPISRAPRRQSAPPRGSST